ncbi:MAG: hypothetical protein AAGK74_01650 [Chloroflexota bacterium]
MRRYLLLILSIVFLLFVLLLRRNEDGLRYVVPNRPPAVLYATTFDDGVFGADWSQQDRTGGTIEVADDALNLTFAEIVPGRQRLRSTTTYLFRNFDYSVTAAATAGPLNNGYGVVFRQFDEQTYYLFLVSSDGWYSVWRELPEGFIALSAWIPSEAINQGVDGEINRLRVTAQGDTFRFYVNDEPLMLCIPDDPGGESTYTNECIGGTMQDTLTDDSIPVGRLGVAIETIIDGGMAAQFDNAVVMGVPES